MQTDSIEIKRPSRKQTMIIPIIAILVVLYTGLGQRLLLQCDGRVVSSKELPKAGNNPDVMEYTQYVFRNANGTESTIALCR